jgi:hypothetical protein
VQEAPAEDLTARILCGLLVGVLGLIFHYTVILPFITERNQGIHSFVLEHLTLPVAAAVLFGRSKAMSMGATMARFSDELATRGAMAVRRVSVIGESK